MTKLRQKNVASVFKPIQRASLVKKNSQSFSTRSTLDRKFFKRLISHFSKLKKEKSSESCPVEDSSEIRVDDQVKLKCRQLPNVVQELRKALMRQDWNELTTLVMILCHPGLKYYTTIILRVCFILLFNHPNSSTELVKNFIRLTTGYILEEDVKKFIKILFALRKSALTPLESGKYKRKTGDYRVVRDFEFEEL